MATDSRQWETCSVTGKMLPANELVTFQGQLVSAEGKAILLEHLRSGDNLGDQLTPTLSRRFGCLFLDGLICLAIRFVVGIIGALIWAILQGGEMEGFKNSATFGGLLMASHFLAFAYFGQMHAMYGQTFGKMAGGLRVVKQDGSPIGYSTAYLRALWHTLPLFLEFAFFFSSDRTLWLMIRMVTIPWALTTIIMVLADSATRRSLHDRLAGTRVVMVEK